jgi:hypothetical protein
MCKPTTIIAVSIVLFITSRAGASEAADVTTANASAPAAQPTLTKSPGIRWRPLMIESLKFLVLEHGFRYATQQATREPNRSFFRGYAQSLGNIHGWADGDPFLINYVGHPMQGAVSGFLFAGNDGDYEGVSFGSNRAYWKSRLRAAAFMFAYSEQFEIGPLSEASIGDVQSWHPQVGFADHVISPAIGLGWMVTEDFIDHTLLRRIEARTRNRVIRDLLRGGLNPSRSLANVLAGRLPWYREPERAVATNAEKHSPISVIPSFQLLTAARVEMSPRHGGPRICAGGGGTAAFRLSAGWDLVGEVAGCKLLDLRTNLSGDSLTWRIGPRKVWNQLNRWQPYVQLLAGGRKLTWEDIDPVKKAEVLAESPHNGGLVSATDRALYAHETEGTGLAITAAAGLDVRLTQAIGIRVAEASYTRSGHAGFEDMDYSHSVGITSGMILRWGTW